MEESIEVYFPGGKRVDAKIGDMIVHTDQSKENGGEGTAPDPFRLFLVSVAACAGYYALQFCISRAIPSEGMGLSLSFEFDKKKRLCERLDIHLTLPDGFPEKYKEAIL